MYDRRTLWWAERTAAVCGRGGGDGPVKAWPAPGRKYQKAPARPTLVHPQMICTGRGVVAASSARIVARASVIAMWTRPWASARGEVDGGGCVAPRPRKGRRGGLNKNYMTIVNNCNT